MNQKWVGFYILTWRRSPGASLASIEAKNTISGKKNLGGSLFKGK